MKSQPTILWYAHTPLIRRIGAYATQLEAWQALTKAGGDGVGPTGGIGGWGGALLGVGGQWGVGGMIVVTSHTGCRAWDGEFEARIGPNGDCSHMKSLLRDEDAIPLLGGRAYRLNETCVHEPLALETVTKRQFVRLSMPSEAP